METYIVEHGEDRAPSKPFRRTPQPAGAAVPRIRTPSLAKRMEEDLATGIVKPTTALNRLLTRYGEHLTNVRLVAAMRAACHNHGQTAGRSFVVVDPDTDRVLSSRACPKVIPKRFGNEEKWAMSQCISRIGKDYDNTRKDYNARGELFLEVYAMPLGSYRTVHVDRVRAVAARILTLKWWDLDTSQPPQNVNLGMKRRLQGMFSPRLGYQGFDGEAFRDDWHPDPQS